MQFVIMRMLIIKDAVFLSIIVCNICKSYNRINYYQEGNQVHPRLDVSTAFRRALMTWASWVDRHINPRKTRVFFRSSAPSHFRFALIHS